MSLPEILQEFDDLDKSSSEFPDRLISLFSTKEYKDCIPRLRDEDVSWLVEYLDNVRISIALYPLSVHPA